jgi:Domain of unknown function (DUF3425).
MARNIPSGTENIGGVSSAVVEGVAPIAPKISEHSQQISDMQPTVDGSPVISLAAVESIHILDPDPVKIRKILQQLEAMARTQYMLGSPRTDMLLHLIQFNFIKALRQNMNVLGLSSEHLHDDAISPFNVTGPWQCNIEVSLPSSLRPTVIQRTVPHHPWLDLLPIPEMRDNLISAGESYDETRLCLDMKGYGSAYADYTGIIVWRDPWDSTGWKSVNRLLALGDGCSETAGVFSDRQTHGEHEETRDHFFACRRSRYDSHERDPFTLSE